MALLLLSWAAAAVLAGPEGDFPLNDDWQYAYLTRQLLETGALEMQGYFAPISSCRYTGATCSAGWYRRVQLPLAPPFYPGAVLLWAGGRCTP
ncbi:MAG: hypothetical protein H6556_07710 [Lewinellaceae bacterium]|nr:hypothetical protein [Lewinellaceae bacterium]